MAKAPAPTKSIAPIYAASGPDDYLRGQAIREIMHRVLGQDPNEMGLIEYDGESADPAAVFDECRSRSLMADAKVVLVRGADPFVTRHREALENYAAKPDPDGVLLLDCRRLDARWRLTKAIEKLGGLISCAAPRMQDLPGWVMQHARSIYHKSIEPSGARRLVELIGDSLGRLDTELGKLTAFVGARDQIREADVEEMVGASRSETVFKITDAIARRDAAGALAIWEQLVNLDRKAPFMATGGLAVGFRRLADAKRLVEGGMNVQEAARRLNMWGDPAALKRQLDRFTLRRWQDQLLKLLRIDSGVKLGLGSVENAIEKFIVELCGPAPA